MKEFVWLNMKDKIIKLGFSSREVDELLKVSKNIEKDYLKLKQNYPIQYLIGYVDFYGYKIDVNEDVLIPRYETELLVEKTIKYIKKIFNNNVNILDIGTGSGAIAIALKKNIDSNITGVDISDKALLMANKNAINNNIDINFIKSNIFSNINDKYDVIISNPPYISIDEEVMDSVKKYEPHLALYADDNGLYFYKRIIEEANLHLNKKFIIAFEIGYWQADLIKEIALKYFPNSKILIEKDYTNRDRYVFIINE